MNTFLNRVAIGSTLTIASLFAGVAVAAPSESNSGQIVGEFETVTQKLDDSSPLEVPEMSNAVTQPELLADQSLSGMGGQESYHLAPLTGAPEDESEAQVTSVSQLSDVQPTDWAFQALQSLVERYGCIAGYPDGTFRGSRSATRYELAAALNACLDNISDKFATKEDLEAVKALQEEFQAELATLRGRVDGLEARTDTLEAQQFSTTTKLAGEVVMALSGFLDGGNEPGGPDPTTVEQESRPRATGRIRFNFLSSFSGEDLLYTRLYASNQSINFSTGGAPFTDQTGTAMTRLSWDTPNTNNDVILDRLSYKFPIGDKLNVTVFGNAAFHHYYATTTNPYYEGGGGAKGAISWFGERNPIFRNGTVGTANVTGAGAQYDITDKLRFDVGYLAGRTQNAVAVPAANFSADPTNTEDEGGLFGGTYGVLAQLSYKPFDGGQVALTYLRNNAPDGNIRSGVGSGLAQVPFGGAAFSADSFGLETSLRFAPQFAVGGWVGYTKANQANSGNSADILNAAVNLTAFDIFKEGSQLGVILGLPPKKINDSRGAAFEDPDTTLHLEGLFQFPVNDNITITPGVIYLLNPEHNNDFDNTFVGVLRTTFSF